MNRYAKEAKRKSEEARKGLNPEQIRELDAQEAEHKAILEWARLLHIEKFPEEYDHMYDSVADANERSQGRNPMRAEYIDRVNEKRRKLGVSMLSGSGMPTSEDTWNLCLQEARKDVERVVLLPSANDVSPNGFLNSPSTLVLVDQFIFQLK